MNQNVNLIQVHHQYLKKAIVNVTPHSFPHPSPRKLALDTVLPIWGDRGEAIMMLGESAINA